jgi:hypothetical protein
MRPYPMEFIDLTPRISDITLKNLKIEFKGDAGRIANSLIPEISNLRQLFFRFFVLIYRAGIAGRRRQIIYVVFVGSQEVGG